MKGDVLFGFEPKGICQHSDTDASEVAWLYHDACQPSRWVSTNGDPTNQTPPFKCVAAPLNHFGKIVATDGDFYGRCGRLPRSGEQPMVVRVEAWAEETSP